MLATGQHAPSRLRFRADHAYIWQMENSTRREFDSVDRTRDPDDFIRYLDKTRSTDFIQRIKQLKLALMDLHAGECAADIGCGTGEDACALASLVGARGHAVGLDLSSRMIATARQRAAAGSAGRIFVFFVGAFWFPISRFGLRTVLQEEPAYFTSIWLLLAWQGKTDPRFA